MVWLNVGGWRQLGAIVARLRSMRDDDSLVLIGTTIASNLLRIASSMLLTRLLAPDVFGLVGIIISIFYIVTMLTDLGFQGYVVRHPDGDDRRFQDVIWTIHAGRGVGLVVLASLLALPAAHLLAKPDLAFPLAVASLIFLFNGVASLSLITALRARQIRKLCYLDLGLQIFQTIVSVAAAVVLRNVWSIILAMVTSAIVRAILSYTLFPGSRSGIAVDRAVSKDLWRFSRIILGSSLLTLLISQADKVVLARVFDLDTFGLYVIATTLASVPLGFVTSYTGRILYPLYASIFREAPDQLSQVYYAGRRSLSLLYSFATAGLIGSAPLIVNILYDHRYAGASTYLSLLALASVMALGNRAANEALTAMGYVQATLIGNVYRLVWLVVAGIPALHFFGPLGLVTVVGLIELPPQLYNWRLLRRFGLFNLREEAILLGVAVAGAAAGFLINNLVSFLYR